jgi:hypothetical protein
VEPIAGRKKIICYNNLPHKPKSYQGPEAMGELAAENIKKTINGKYLVALLLLLIIGVGSGIYYFSYWRQTPRYALWQMVQAVQANDTQTLFQYVDLQAIADNLTEKSSSDIDTWLLQKGFGATPGEDDISRLTRSLTKKFARLIAPKVVAALEPQIKAGVEKYLAELNTMQKAALSAIPAKAEIQQQDGIAKVKLVDPNSGQTFQFSMAKPPEGNRWRIVEINYQDLRTVIEKKFIE